MTEDFDAALQPGLDLLWDRRGGGRQGPKPGLSIDAIASTAIAVADAHGLDAVSMARVAKELGFTTMSLYRYVESKDELMLVMADVAVGDPPPGVAADGDWQERLRSWTTAQLDGLRRHPWMLDRPISGPPMGPHSTRWVELGFAALDGTGLDEGEKLGVLSLLSVFVLSQGRLEREVSAGAEAPGAVAGYGETLRRLVDEGGFPALYRAAWSGDLDGPGTYDEETDFGFGLDRIIDGVAVLVDARTPPSDAHSR